MSSFCPHFSASVSSIHSPSSSPSAPPPLLPLPALHSRFRNSSFQSSLKSNQVSCSFCSCSLPNKDLWACLHCEAVCCGRFTQRKHAVQHERATTEAGGIGHILCMNLETRTIWCYRCDAEVKDNMEENAGRNGQITPLLVRAAMDENDNTTETDEVEASTPARHPSSSSSSSSTAPRRKKAGSSNRSSSPVTGNSSDSENENVKPVTYLDYYNSHKGGEVGLSNLGNTCFLSASLQALLHCPPLLAFFTPVNSAHANADSVKVKLVFDISILLQKCWSGKFNVCTPTDIVRDILFLYPYFRGYGHHDSQEALKYLLNNMHEAIQIVPQYDYCETEEDRQKAAEEAAAKAAAAAAAAAASPTPNGTSTPMKSPEPPSPSPSPSPSSSSSSTSKPPVRRFPDTSILTDIFQGSLESRVHCSNCNAISIVYDPCWDLSLDLPKEAKLKLISAERGVDAAGTSSRNGNGGWFSSLCNLVGLTSTPLSLETCLHSFCTSDRLLNADQYKCDKCKLKVDATKYLHLHKLPEILMISLKRFTHNSYFGSKVNRTVTFPLYGLDMEPFLAESSPEHGKTKRKSRTNGNGTTAKSGKRGSLNHPKETLYDLFAVVRHIGGTSGGHYVCVAKNHNTGKWFEFDDRIVTEVTEDRVSKTEAYVLFYRRRRGSEAVQQLLQHVKAAQVLESNPQSSSGPSSSSSSSSSSFPLASPFPPPIPTRYISRHWLKKLTVLQRIEPIDNRDLVCLHGFPYGLPPDGGPTAVPVSIEGWEKLQKLVGGGPVVTGEKQECEICSLPLIRLREKRRVSRFDTQASENSKPTDPFYLIHDTWLRRWREFIADKGPRPGPITNHELLEPDGKTAKAGLQKMSDYRGLHGLVFNELHKMYGGGPTIVRATMNLYDLQPVPGVSEEEGGPPGTDGRVETNGTDNSCTEQPESSPITGETNGSAEEEEVSDTD